MPQPTRIIAGSIGVLLASGAAAAHAQSPASPANPAERPSLEAVWAVRPPVLDGRLDDEVWQGAAVATDFRQRAPRPGEPASERTEARVAIDGTALYVAIRAWDSSPDSIASQLARRDATGIFSDWVDVIVDSFHDRRTAYRFSVNPHGVKKDVYHYNDGSEDLGWDAVWEVATQIDEHGWTAEFRIPLSQLRYRPGDGEQTWGLQFGRIIARRDEVSFWSQVTPDMPGFISLAGTLTGLHSLGSPKRLEVLPYAVSKLTRAPRPEGPVENPFWRATQPGATAGADIRYGVTSNLTLTATINPDFGQVEADPSVVNLSAFETFYPERRPFFLEGANLFTFNIGDDGAGEGLFYSRRIGRAPQRSNLGADHVDMPEAARIIGAAKLTGRVGGWSVGAFNAVTQAEHAEILRGGEVLSTPVEPLTNYAVARVNRDFRGGGSTLGVMLTSMNRRIDDDVFDFLRTSAYSGGVTAQHRFGPGNRYVLGGYVAGSAIHGDTLSIQLAQRAPQRLFHRPDADHVDYRSDRTSLHGLTGSLGFDKVGGGNWRGGVGTVFRTPGFEVNDVGFQQNADERFVYGWFNYNRFQPGRIFRNYAFGINPNAGWNFGGTRLWTQVNFWGNANFANFWSASVSANNRWHATSTGALRGGPALHAPGSNNFNLGINTDRRRAVSFNVNTNGNREKETGVVRYGFGGGVTMRPSPQLDLSLQPSVSWNEHDWQYVAAPTAATGHREYIVAHLDQTTVSLTTRMNYTVTPTLSVQLYAQPFLSAGSYDSFRRVASPRARAFDERFHTFAGDEISYDVDGRRYTARIGADSVRFDNPDFNVRSLRSNAVLRWEYRPGSTLFVVWSHGRAERTRSGEFDFGRGVRDLRDASGTNVVMLKLNYWLDL